MKKPNFNSKLLIVLLIMIISVPFITACSSDEPEYSDAKFIKALSSGLEDRWTLTDKIEKSDDGVTVQNLSDAINCELNAISSFDSATFEDTKLQEKALSYINILKEQQENINWYFSDDFDEMDKWEKLYNERTILLKDFVDNYSLTVSSKYQDQLDELIAEGKTAASKASTDEEMNALVNSLEFTAVDNDYGYVTYEAILENTTENEIEDIWIDISFLDKDGIILDTDSTYAENVKPGAKAKLTFETDLQFDKYELTLDSYEIK